MSSAYSIASNTFSERERLVTIAVNVGSANHDYVFSGRQHPVNLPLKMNVKKDGKYNAAPHMAAKDEGQRAQTPTANKMYNTVTVKPPIMDPPTRGQPLIRDTLHGTICVI